jgi:hypothetical protein
MTSAQKKAHAKNGTTPAPAQNRKKVQNMLEALARKDRISPFIIRGNIVANTSVSFDTTNLDAFQRKFVKVCEKVINTEQIPIFPAGTTFDEKDSLAFVMYLNKDDLAAGLLIGLEVTPDFAFEDMVNKFSAMRYTSGCNVKSGDFIPLANSSQTLFPNIKDANHIEANNDWFETYFNIIKDEGMLVSPDDSYPVCYKDESRNGWVVG